MEKLTDVGYPPAKNGRPNCPRESDVTKTCIIPYMSTTLPPKHAHEGLWDSLLDAEMNVRYWTEVSGKMVQHDRLVRFVIALTSSGTAVAAWTITKDHPSVWKAVTGFSSILAIYHSFFYASDRIKKSGAILTSWKDVEVGFGLLWEEDRTLTAPKLWKEYENLKERTKKIDEIGFTRDPSLVLRSQQAVRRARGLK